MAVGALSLPDILIMLGTVHFLRGRGDWWDLGESPKKKTASKGGGGI